MKWRSIAADLLLIAGAASLTYGAWLIYAPLGYLAGGALAILASTRLA